MYRVIFTAVVFVAIAVSPVFADTSSPDKRPEFPTSIANANSAHFRNGPIFQQAQKAFLAARDGGQSAFESYLVNGTKLEFRAYVYPESPRNIPIDARFVRAMIDSCDGPLSYDEGSNWVELNWVCRVDPESPLASYYTFRESPEITMLINFSGGKIAKVMAMEPLAIPGTKRLAMNAYAVAHNGN